MQTFDMHLISPAPAPCGFLRVTYNEHGFLYADYYLANFSRLPDRLYNEMLKSTLFAGVMEQIEAAIENNRHTERIDSLNAQIERLNWISDDPNATGADITTVYEDVRKRREELQQELNTLLDNYSHLLINPS